MFDLVILLIWFVYLGYLCFKIDGFKGIFVSTDSIDKSRNFRSKWVMRLSGFFVFMGVYAKVEKFNV